MTMAAFTRRMEAANRVNEYKPKDDTGKTDEEKKREHMTPQEIIEADRHRKPEARLSDMD